VRRLTLTLATSATAFALLAASAIAHDGGQGWYGEADDKVITNAGFMLIAFFPLFILFMSLLQWQLDKRKYRRKAAHKQLAGVQRFRGGW